MSFCPRDGAELEAVAIAARAIERCPMCRGVWVKGSDLDALVGGGLARRAAGLSLDGTDAAALRCPSCEASLTEEEVRAARLVVHTCSGCAASWLDDGQLAALRAAHRSIAAPLAPRPAAPVSDPEPLRRTFFSPHPGVELAAVPALLGVLWAFTATGIGEVISFFPRIQFHELGHALVAWGSGRRALPLPCGLTFWSLERSPLLVVLEIALCAGLLIAGVRRRSAALIALGVALGAALSLGLGSSLDASEPWLIAGGSVGEIMLPALAVAAFHLPLPERVRWDFWRWLVLLVAGLALVSVVRAWWEIAAGARPLPVGTFLMNSTSADGDLDRLMREHGWSEQGIRDFYGTLATIAITLALGVHAVVAGARLALHRRDSAGP